jgi:hypothetical protein
VDECDITEHPVESGSPISDHAYDRQPEVIVRMAWSNSPQNNFPSPMDIVGGGALQSIFSGAGTSQIKQTYMNLLVMMHSHAMFTLYTGKRTYTNMVCKSLICGDNDFRTENALFIVMVCRQVRLVDTKTSKIDPNAAKSPESTPDPTNTGNQNATPAGDVNWQIVGGDSRIAAP